MILCNIYSKCMINIKLGEERRFYIATNKAITQVRPARAGHPGRFVRVA